MDSEFTRKGSLESSGKAGEGELHYVYKNDAPDDVLPPSGGSSAKGGEGGYLSLEYQVSQKLHALRNHSSWRLSF